MSIIRFFACLLLVALVVGPAVPTQDLSLNLLEAVLEPIQSGGSLHGIAKLTKAIVQGTKACHPSVKEIANMRNDCTFERSLHRWALRQYFRNFLPDLYEFKLLKDMPGGPRPCSHYACLPHELFSALYHHSHDLFCHLFTGPPGNLEDWWRAAEVEGADWIRRHPVVLAQPDPAKRIPFGLHGDDAGMQGILNGLVDHFRGIFSYDCISIFLPKPSQALPHSPEHPQNDPLICLKKSLNS